MHFYIFNRQISLPIFQLAFIELLYLLTPYLKVNGFWSIYRIDVLIFAPIDHAVHFCPARCSKIKHQLLGLTQYYWGFHCFQAMPQQDCPKSSFGVIGHSFEPIYPDTAALLTHIFMKLSHLSIHFTYLFALLCSILPKLILSDCN